MTPSTPTDATPEPLSRERADLLESIAKQRWFLTYPAHGLSDEQARLRPTASELTLGGIIKHVAATERQWAAFITGGADAFAGTEPDDWAAQFVLGEGETLAGTLAHYAEVAAVTDRLITTLPTLDVDHELPQAPWFEAGARWSARRVIVHVIAETAQHAGHADILRESIDGQKSMG